LVGSFPVNIQANGSVTVVARDLNLKSTNGCTPSEDNLIFAFSSNPTNTTKTFSCADLGNGISGVVPTQVYVIDSRGNYNAATVNIMVSDLNFNACPNDSSAVVLQGIVTDEELKGVANIAVSAFNPVTQRYESVNTDANGRYKISGLLSYQDYMVTPSLEGYDLKGVSTLDLVLIQRHILGLAPLSSPYKVIAADVNGSESISGSDLAELRKLLLGINSTIVDSWRFIRKDYQFSNTLSPWDYPTMAELYNVSSDVNALDFIGLKVGDVNGGAFAALAQDLAGPRSSVNLSYHTEQNGDLTTYILTPQFNDDIFGMQLAIKYDEKEMEFVNIEGLSIEITDDMVADFDGQVKLSYISAEPIYISELPLMQLTFRAKGKKIPTIGLDNSFSPEIYNSLLETNRLNLSKESNFAATKFELLQNVPNPFSGQTTIAFSLSESDRVDFTVTDLGGRLVYKTSGIFAKGVNKINIDSNEFAGSGIYYYSIMTPTAKETKRMIVLD
jgi:hypothetical protein